MSKFETYKSFINIDLKLGKTLKGKYFKINKNEKVAIANIYESQAS